MNQSRRMETADLTHRMSICVTTMKNTGTTTGDVDAFHVPYRERGCHCDCLLTQYAGEEIGFFDKYSLDGLRGEGLRS